MIRAFQRTADGRLRRDLSPEEFPAAIGDPQGLLWIDMEDEPAASSEPLLLNTFGFHPLAVDDALQENHVPKVDDWGGYLYLVLHAILFHDDPDNGEHLDTLELDIFLGPNYVVTAHDKPVAAVNRVWDACGRTDRHLRHGADHLTYRLADELVADYMPAVERLEETIDRIEDQAFERQGTAVLQRIFNLKRVLLHLHRIIIPQREVLNRLSRGDFAVVDAEDRVLFRDIYDHLVRLNDINENMRDLLGSVMDIYLSVANNRMNEIVKTLTIITTLFMPITFLTGFFGMNFFQPVAASLKPWTSPAAFAAVAAVLVGAPLGMYLWVRRRGWMQRFR